MLSKIKSLLTSQRLVRFVQVGVTNALINFSILNLAFYRLGINKIFSSILATTCALIFSFILNRHYVFSDKNKRAHQQILPFILVTISGSLLILNLVYIASLHILDGHEAIFITVLQSLTGITFKPSFIDINLSTVIGALVAMFWNYNGYRLFVFTGKQPASEYESATNS